MVSRNNAGDWIFWGLYAFLALALSAWISLAGGHNTVRCVLITTALGVVYGLILFRIKLRHWIQVATLFAAIAIFAVFIGLRDVFGPVYFSWLGGFIAGAIFGAWPRLGEPPRENSTNWLVNGNPVASSDQALGLARACVFELDGQNQYVVTVSHHVARLDIVGDASAGLVVYCTRDARNKKDWYLLSNTTGSQASATVSAGTSDILLTEENVVSVPLACQALEGFLRLTGPDQDLAWLSGDRTFELRPLSVTRWFGQKKRKPQGTDRHQ